MFDIPSTLNDDSVMRFIKTLNQHIEDREISINFKTLQWAQPSGTLMFAEAIKQFVSIRQDKGLSTYYHDLNWLKHRESGAVSYLKYFGFFKYCDIDAGNTPNKSSSSSRYIPIKVLSTEYFTSLFSWDWRSRIERECENLAKLIIDDMYSVKFLGYSFREVIRNVFEHSGVKACTIMAQYWPSRDLLEIAVADRGHGIHETLKDKYKSASPLDSLLLSLKAGVSRNNIETPKSDNSGFGLYVLSNVGKHYGEFSILSSGAYVKIAGNNQSTQFEKTYFQGTIIKIQVKKHSLEYFPNLFEKLKIEGDKELKERLDTSLVVSKKL